MTDWALTEAEDIVRLEQQLQRCLTPGYILTLPGINLTPVSPPPLTWDGLVHSPINGDDVE